MNKYAIIQLIAKQFLQTVDKCFFDNYNYYAIQSNVPLAQLDRASGYGPEGWGFDSLRVHHLILRGGVAQLVERRTENPCVTGSNPVDATKLKGEAIMIASPFFIAAIAAEKQSSHPRWMARLFFIGLPEGAYLRRPPPFAPRWSRASAAELRRSPSLPPSRRGPRSRPRSPPSRRPPSRRAGFSST